MACNQNLAHGPSLEGLRLEVLAARTTIDIGDTLSVAVRLQNSGSVPIHLTFSSSCQVLPYIEAALTGRVLYPAGGTWVCATVITNLVLAPGAEQTRTLLIRGANAVTEPGPGLPLAPGSYVLYARLAHADYPLKSAPLSLQIR